ncbi:MAG TPA: protein kinase [Planctomycetota bacterium]|nr:protein kinase [Planctomycetota bacterium]
MAANSDSEKDRAGGAVGGITPPSEKTMQYIPGGEKTIAQPPPSSAQNTLVQSQQTMPVSGSSLPQATPASLGGKTTRTSVPDFGGENVQLAVEIQDLTGERLLLAAPRVEAHGRTCPALNSIPLLAKIGQGGMGAVYYGIHPRLRSEVAVKVLPFHLAEQDPGMIRRFFREAQIAAQVRSPHLCNVMDVNEEAGLFFLVMEYVTGCTAGQYLKALIEKGGQGLSEKDTLDIVIAATEGLWAAHSQGVVHRDIKPENIMIPYAAKGSKDYDLRRAKLMDLGLARSEEGNQSLTGAQSAMGTPGYMAPEQAMDAKTADKRSDVFSMGATMYCLLSGKPPFKGETVMKVLMATMHEPHEPVVTHCPQVSPMLNEIIEKSLSKKQDNRYADAKQLLTALEDCRRLLTGGVGGSSIGAGVRGNSTFVQSPGSSLGRGGTTQNTLVSPGGTTTVQTGGGNKGMMMVAAGVAALALAGGVGFMMMGKKQQPVVDNGGNTGTGSTGTGTGNTGKVTPTVPTGPAPSDIVLKRHAKLIKEADESIANNDPEGARLSLDLAKSLSISTWPDAKKSEDKIDNLLKTFDSRKKFESELKAVDELVTKKNYKDALTRLNLAMKDAPDDAAIKVGEQREKTITEKLKMVMQEEKARKLLDEAEKMLKPAEAEQALRKVDEVKRLFPANGDEFNKKALDLENRLNVVLKEKQRSEEYDRGLKEVLELETKGNWEAASKAAWELRKLIPERPEAPEALKRIQPKLDEKAQLALAEQAKRELIESLGKANDLFNQKQYEKAGEILDGIPKKTDPEYVALKKKVDDALVLLKQEQQQKQKREEFNGIIASAEKAFNDQDLATAKQQLAQAEQMFKDDPVIARLRGEIAKKEEFAKAKLEYDGLLNKIREAIKSTSLDEADRFLTLASKNPAADAKLTSLKAKVDELREEQKKIQNVEAEYANLLSSAAVFEKAGDEKKEFSDKLNSYDLALRKLLSAKPLKKGGEADQREVALRKKIEDTQKAEEVERRKVEEARRLAAEQEAQQKLNRKQFDDRMLAANTSAQQGDFASALANLAEAGKLFPNDPKLVERTAEVKKMQADVDGKIKAAIDLAAQRVPKRQFADAIADVQGVARQYPMRRELSSVVEGITALQRVEGSVQNQLASAAGRLKTIDAKAEGRAGAYRARVTDAQSRMQSLVDNTIDQIVRSRFADATSAIRALETDVLRNGAQLASALDSYEEAARPPAATTTNQGDENPFKENKKKSTPPPTKEKKSSNVGDVNPFD